MAELADLVGYKNPIDNLADYGVIALAYAKQLRQGDTRSIHANPMQWAVFLEELAAGINEAIEETNDVLKILSDELSNQATVN